MTMASGVAPHGLEPPAASTEAMLEFFDRYPRLLVLTGAGCSTGAGIPDYRDANGDWKRSAPMRYQQFVDDELARKRYWARSMVGWRTMSEAEPALAHRALVRLQEMGRIRFLVTQNVDGLHSSAGSKNVVDLHGRIDTVCCLACGVRTPRSALQEELLQRNAGWASLDARSAPDGDADLEGINFARFDVPACAGCAGILKPDVVFFGESVPRERVAAVRAALADSDCLLVAGSSLMVYSGYRFVEDAVATRTPVAIINRGRTRADGVATRKFEQEVGAALALLATRLASHAVAAPALPPRASA